ncbi:hypothetical protein DAEQUDRAFT_32334 [Daedalea quercina L-15889]|uniref:FAD-binding PCMH-type domain-containing protein n=1 Tax=Daedalea quercina L-15889 TaxID=1314783 RepID=A0A165SQX4_9APHY|nr:hypothetical protein DAEQUDRAFT_32334 [Daedalea quercina L-15889]
MPSHKPSPLPPLAIPGSDLSPALCEELRTAVKGTVYPRSTPEFNERAKTFNGKITCLANVLVLPLDAQDVSAIVQFCRKHGLSPSVKAGGYATAGWSIAGNVIIDLGMIRECDIEPPVEGAEAGKDWTRLADMLPPGSKGKGRACAAGKPDDIPAEVAPETSTLPAHETEQSVAVGTKRRREDSPEEDRPLPKLMASQEKRNLLRSYDTASDSVAAFFRGPPLPEEEGEEPRKPPANRRRLTSPERHVGGLDGEGQVDGLDGEGQVDGPSATTARGEAIGMSRSGSESVSGSGSGSGLSESGTHITTPDTDEEPSPCMPPTRSDDPFGYMASDGPTPDAAYPPTLTSTNPFGAASGASSSTMLTPGLSSMSMGMSPWSAYSASSSLGSQGASSAGVGPRILPPSFVFPAGLSMAPGAFPMALPMGVLPQEGGVGFGVVAPAKPVHPHAYVTLGAGMRQKEVDMYTAEHPLEGYSVVTGTRQERSVPYHMPSSAHPVGSSILLLAGFGFISRMYGLSVDNVVEIEMVLADGRVVVVSEDSDPDLWWAIRGAGPAFGIATRYKVRAFPVPVVFAGNLIYRFHRATAASLIKHVRDCIKGAPRELYANVLLTAGPADKDSLVVVQMCYVGPKEQGMEFLNAISSWDGERCLLNEVNEKSYLAQQDSVAQILRGKGPAEYVVHRGYSLTRYLATLAGRQWFIRSALIHSLPDEIINQTVIQFAHTPIGCTWIFELSGGAIADFEDTPIPKEQREAVWTVAALHQWEMGIDDPRCILSAEEWIDGTIGKVALGGPFPSFIGRHEPPSRTMACFGKNWTRLAELKRKYDPECFFKNNFWPIDKHGRPIEALSNEPPSPSP